MKGETVHPKTGLQLRKIGKQFMIVEANDTNVNISDVYSLNQAAARMWEQISQSECTLTDLADYLCETYDIDRETALQDAERQLSEWKAYGLIL